jgi:putative membrane protein
MIRAIIKWVLFALALILIAKIVPGINVEGFKTALFAVVIIGLVNMFIKPIISLLALPLNLLTLGLFTLVINAGLFALSSYFVHGFHVGGFIPALIGSILFSILSMIINASGKLIPV